MRADNIKVGLVIGKFLPYHKGHELLIKAALETCYYVHVIIGVRDDDPWSYEQRANWIRESVGEEWNRFKFFEVQDDVPEPTYDENGTAQEQWFWDAWIKKINKARPYDGPRKRTHLFSSDLYGERLAKELDLIWYPVDPNRELFEISGTEIRENLYSQKSWKMLPEPVRQELAYKVAIVGPESTGKSTMTNRLAVWFIGNGAQVVQEYGRTLSVLRKHDMTVDDFDAIIRTQNLMIREAAKVGPIVFTDTEAITTELFADVYLDPDHGICADDYWKYLSWSEKHKFPKIDLYILLSPDVEWVQDGERVIPDLKDRIAFYNKLRDRLVREGKQFVEIHGDDYKERGMTAMHAVNKVIMEKSRRIASRKVLENA